jgi:predicted amidophosphoribosyltransferase
MHPSFMHPGYCPQCGERVSPFAAGCALCGADLDPKRWQQPASLSQRFSIRFPTRWRRVFGSREAASVSRRAR